MIYIVVGYVVDSKYEFKNHHSKDFILDDLSNMLY